MRIGIIGPTSFKERYEIFGSSEEKAKEIISKIAEIVSKRDYQVNVCADYGSVSEFFIEKYLKNKGKKVFSFVPLDDKKFGYKFVNNKIGEVINCGTWETQPERLVENSEALICLGYSAGTLIEVFYSKWFGRVKKMPVYIIKELVSGKLPKEVESNLNLRYISYKNFEKEFK